MRLEVLWFEGKEKKQKNKTCLFLLEEQLIFLGFEFVHVSTHYKGSLFAQQYTKNAQLFED